ncbi:CBO0543 family protein [Bacillus sp. UMB0893]|uniref:CBO0543 family protein n=1 Tax=Bacillus sp. UMB0893 TaxID=2066053 RepID=UPI000C78ED8E|nr:CBO0543 family protein [Bacillus sp. UMB0893]PLR66046.1 hypothetical protein CYJ36_20495 [Bacillus sp. UMB0893]QNG60726.1 hypothetical protein H4O14_04230 [Bacillus sp. PAMC26568]
MRELIVLVLIWAAAILLLVFKVPREKRRDANIVFLFSQSLAWLYVYIQTFTGNMEFPFREFHESTKMSFSLYYIFYPAISVFFILYYPKKGFLKKCVYFGMYAYGIQGFAYLLAQYTELITYNNYSLLMQFFINCGILIIVRGFYYWFQKGFVK